MEVELRAIRAEDLPVLAGGGSEFDEFGPRGARTEPPPPDLHGRGGLSIVADGEVAGELSWHRTVYGPNPESHCPMIGIWLVPAFRGRGIGRIAQARMAALLFTHTRAERVEASTDVENVAEQRALEAAGFRREGVLRGAQWRRGAFHDLVMYAVRRGDPLSG